MEWRKTSLHRRRRRLHGRIVVRRRRRLDAGRRGRGVSGRKVVMAQWVVAVERLLGASPKLLQLLTRALNLSRQEELQHGAQIGIPLRIIDILFFRRDKQPTFILPVRPVRSINMHYPLHALFSALLASYTSTTHSPSHSLTGCCWSGSRGGSTLDGGDSFLFASDAVLEQSGWPPPLATLVSTSLPDTVEDPTATLRSSALQMFVPTPFTVFDVLSLI